MNYALKTLLKERGEILNKYLKEPFVDMKQLHSDQRLKDLENEIELIQVGNDESTPACKVIDELKEQLKVSKELIDKLYKENQRIKKSAHKRVSKLRRERAKLKRKINEPFRTNRNRRLQ